MPWLIPAYTVCTTTHRVHPRTQGSLKHICLARTNHGRTCVSGRVRCGTPVEHAHNCTIRVWRWARKGCDSPMAPTTQRHRSTWSTAGRAFGSTCWPDAALECVLIRHRLRVPHNCPHASQLRQTRCARSCLNRFEQQALRGFESHLLHSAAKLLPITSRG